MLMHAHIHTELKLMLAVYMLCMPVWLCRTKSTCKLKHMEIKSTVEKSTKLSDKDKTPLNEIMLDAYLADENSDASKVLLCLEIW